MDATNNRFYREKSHNTVTIEFNIAQAGFLLAFIGQAEDSNMKRNIKAKLEDALIEFTEPVGD